MRHTLPILMTIILAALASSCVQPQAESPGDPDRINVLTLGGGTHHDFARWFGEEDGAGLEAAGYGAAYTESPADIAAALDTTHVLRITTNQPLPDAARTAIFEYADAGNGLLIDHPGAWYNWADWPGYNRDLVGGGTNSHRDYGEFEVNVTVPDHPIMTGVPESFRLADELYRFERDPEGPAIEVLATAQEVETGEVYPIVWIVAHPRARIVVNTLGHDGAAHTHPAYARILRNSVEWAAEGREPSSR